MENAIEDSIQDIGYDGKGDINVDKEVVVLTRYVPDGGWGWVVVFGAFMFNFISDGCCYSFGVLYVQLLEYFGDTKSKTSWIGSLFFSVPLLCGPIASILCTRFGCRKITIAGGAIATVGFLCSVFATSLETLYVTFGIVAGFGISLPYLASVLIISEYFKKKLALATGIAECGAGIGTIVFAPLIECMIAAYGWRGAILILSGLLSNIIICGALFRPVLVRKSSTDEMEIRNSVLLKTPGQSQNAEDILYKENGQIEIRNYMLVKNCEEKCERTVPIERQDPDDNLYKESDQTKIQNSVLVAISKEASVKTSSEKRVIGDDTSLKENNKTNKNILDDDLEETRVSHHQDGSIPHQTVSDQKQKQSTLCQTCSTALSLSIFKNPIFIMFLISNFILYFFYDVPFVFLVDRAVELKISKSKAAILISVIGVLHTIGNLSFGFAGDYRRISNPLLFGSSIGICGLALSLVPLSVDFIPMSIIGGTFGFLSASSEALGSILLMEIFGEENLCKSYGYTMLLKGIANLVGPPFAGWLYDISGSYDNTFYTTGGCLLFSGILYAIGPMIYKYLTRH